MSKEHVAGSDPWAAIEDEKRRDRQVRRISKVAWTITFILVLMFGVATSAQVAQMVQVFGAGAVGLSAVFWSAMPLIVVLGILSVLIATLSTIAIFFRLRTASLSEIQLRLAALEQILASRPDSE